VLWDMSVWQIAGAEIIVELASYGNVLDKKSNEEMAAKSISDQQFMSFGMSQTILYLSGGNQQKVLLAHWLNVKPKILILDEPARGVDVGAKAEIRKVIQELVDQGISVIVISSDLEELLAMSDRVLVMANGSIKGEFLAREATFDKIMALAVQK